MIDDLNESFTRDVMAAFEMGEISVIVISRSELPESLNPRYLRMRPGVDQAEAEAYVQSVWPGVDPADLRLAVGVGHRSISLLTTVATLQSSWRSGEAQGLLRVADATVHALDGEYFLNTDDPRAVAKWERAFVDVSTEVAIELGEAVRGSWWRRWTRSPAAQGAVTDAARALEVKVLVGPEAQANRDNSEAIARLMEASAGIDETVVVSGSIVFIKLTDSAGKTRVIAETLTPPQLKRFRASCDRPEPLKAMHVLAELADSSGPDLGDESAPRELGPGT